MFLLGFTLLITMKGINMRASSVLLMGWRICSAINLLISYKGAGRNPNLPTKQEWQKLSKPERDQYRDKIDLKEEYRGDFPAGFGTHHSDIA